MLSGKRRLPLGLFDASQSEPHHQKIRLEPSTANCTLKLSSVITRLRSTDSAPAGQLPAAALCGSAAYVWRQTPQASIHRLLCSHLQVRCCLQSRPGLLTGSQSTRSKSAQKPSQINWTDHLCERRYRPRARPVLPIHAHYCRAVPSLCASRVTQNY